MTKKNEMTPWKHEQAYRGTKALDHATFASVVICGAGALGSNIAELLVRSVPVDKLTVIDDDRVEEGNLGTQIYTRDDIGRLKVHALQDRIYSIDEGIHFTANSKRLDIHSSARSIAIPSLIIDTFDNSASRREVTAYARDIGIPCLHAGLHEAYGEVVWNERYRVPEDVLAERPACDVPIARALVTIVAAIAVEEAIRFLTLDRAGVRHNYAVTLRDLRISSEVV